MLTRAVIFHHPLSEGAAAFSRQVAAELGAHGVETFVADAWEDVAAARLETAGLVVCVGGDGTVLRGARVTVPFAIPILGVNMGRLGFLTELSPRDFFDYTARIVAGDWRVEERLMIRGDAPVRPGSDAMVEYHALNDVVVCHPSPGRPIYVELTVDGETVAVYRCDAIIVASPTGSTGYALAAGGPILAPTERQLLVTPVSAHMALGRSLVLPAESIIDLRVTSDHGAVVSVDGQDDLMLEPGSSVRVRASDHVTRFARFRSPSSFFAHLADKLESQLSSRTYNGD